MKVIDEGHKYELIGGQTLQFMKPAEGIAGTTNEEVFEILINRLEYLQTKFPCIENEMAILSAQIGLEALNERTAKRVAQGIKGQDIAHV